MSSFGGTGTSGIEDQFADAADDVVQQQHVAKPSPPKSSAATAAKKPATKEPSSTFLPRPKEQAMRLWNNQNNKVRKVSESSITNNFYLMEAKKAARLVANQLRLGTWPEAAPGLHCQTAGAIEQFVLKIYGPYIQAQVGNREPNQKRIFYSTLLALREVLAQNADNIFTLPSVEVVPDQSAEDAAEEDVFAKLLLATSVVAAACESGGRDSDFLLKLIESDEMAADRAHATWIPMCPNGKALWPQESLAWKVSYNLAQKQRAAESACAVVSMPKATACFATVVENVPSSSSKK